MIVLLKIYATKIYLKAIIDNFFVVCDKGRDRGTQFFGGGDIQQKGES